MKRRVLLFGSIGTLVETSEFQRLTFNAAFREAGLDWDWSPDLYRLLLDGPGGRSRIARFAADRGEWVDASALHDRKTELFHGMVMDQQLRARAGVEEVIEQAKAEGITLGLASTTSARNIDAIFAGLKGAIKRSDFAYVGHRGLVSGTKPAPDIYLHATRKLGVAADNVLAIEDTASSLASAKAAGIPCIGFPGAYASHQSFDDAVMVTRHLSWSAIEAASHEPAISA